MTHKERKLDSLIYQIPFLKRFKGERSYVSGADVTLGILMFLSFRYGSDATLSAVKLRSFSRHELVILTGDFESSDDIVATFKYDYQGSVMPGYLVSPKKEVIQRISFDESLVAGDTMSYKDRLISHKVSVFGFIEDVVILTKRLHNKLFPESEKWILSQLDFAEQVPDDYIDIEIKIIHNIKNKFTVSNIIVNGDFVGKIGFTELK